MCRKAVKQIQGIPIVKNKSSTDDFPTRLQTEDSSNTCFLSSLVNCAGPTISHYKERSFSVLSTCPVLKAIGNSLNKK